MKGVPGHSRIYLPFILKFRVYNVQPHYSDWFNELIKKKSDVKFYWTVRRLNSGVWNSRWLL